MKLLRGGRLVRSDGIEPADLLMEGETIKAIGKIDQPGAEVIDVSGKLIFPGFIDPHTHLEMSGGCDDFHTATKGAIMGGTTMVIDYATQSSGGLVEAFHLWQAMAQKSCCDYLFHMSPIRKDKQLAEEMFWLQERGISSYKLYLAYDDLRMNETDFVETLKALDVIGAFVGVHCEDGDMIKQLQQEALERGEIEPLSHALTRPPETESRAIDYLMNRAEGCINIVHLSSKDGLERVRYYKQQNKDIVAETCPQYLLLDRSLLDQSREEAVKFIFSPPLRTAEHRDALWQGIVDGVITTIATDHCNFSQASKINNYTDFSRVLNGIPGVETRVHLMLSEFDKRGLGYAKAVELLSTAVAKQYGLYPQKGELAVGSDADLVIYDPTVEWTIKQELLSTPGDYTPYEGWNITGKIAQVYLRGQLAVDNEKWLGSLGRFQTARRTHDNS